MTTVSLVVPVRNAERVLPKTLHAIGKLSPPPDELIFVDNASSDGSRRLLERFVTGDGFQNARLVCEPRRGASVARNTGARTAQGETIAFADADCLPSPDWLAELTGPFGESRVGAVAGRIVPAPPATRIEHLGALFTLPSSSAPARFIRWNPWSGGFPTANLAIRRDVFRRLQGFDESVRIYGEDYDLCARIYAAGWEIEYAPRAVVAHHHRSTLSGVVRQGFGFGRSHPYLLRRHARRGLWLDLPGRSVSVDRWPWPLWVDLASLDKKLVVLAIGGLVVPALWWTLPLVTAWVASDIARRLRSRGNKVTVSLLAVLIAGLFLKSAAMTAGRWWGSLRYARLCL